MEGRQRGRSDLNSQGLDQGSLVTGKKDRSLQRGKQGERGEGAVSKPEFQSLERVNKLVFVREFELAYDELRRICNENYAHTEALFRLVEVGVRIDRYPEVKEFLGTLSAQAQETESQAALGAALVLADIRWIEQNNETESEDHLVNPSLHRGDGFGGMSSSESLAAGRDVVGLGGRDVELGSGLHLGRSFLGLAGLESSRRGYIIGKSVRVARSPLVADDFPPFDPNRQELESFGSSSSGSSNEGEEVSDEEALRILNEASDLLVKYPDHFGAWYVHGCASELAGQLSQAIESWQNAYRKNPRSLAVLSTMSELQQMGALGHGHDVDYSKLFESSDRFAVHGTLETHMALYTEFLNKGEFRFAIAAVRTLADWLQRQKGEVPAEIEILCLLAAMKAHRLEGNSGAAESCRREAENLAVSFKKSQQDLTALAFVAARAEEFELPALARMCYFSIITSPLASKDLVLRVSAHCVSLFPSRALAECLKSAYRIHRGDPEIRFCQVLCSLAMAQIPVKEYLDRKSKIRDLLSREELGDAVTLLQECARQTGEDPEVHYYLAEIYSRLGADHLAVDHYEAMYSLDALNTESVIRYIQFLLKMKQYKESETCARTLLEEGNVSVDQEGEIHWSMAASAFAREQLEFARMSIDRALSCDPWNMSFLALAMRLASPSVLTASTRSEEIAESDALLTQFEDSILGESEALAPEFVARWVIFGSKIVRAGYSDFGFLMACAVFRDWNSDEAVREFMSLAGAAFDTRLATQRMMLLLQRPSVSRGSDRRNSGTKTPNKGPGSNRAFLGQIALCMARTYAQSGEWPLVDEWIDIANKSGMEDPASKATMFWLEALRLVFGGTHSDRARSLLEAALDCMNKKQPVYHETMVAYGYILVLQGDFKAGIEKIQQNIKQSSSILGLFLAVKALERTGQLKQLGNEVLERLLSCTPSTRLESRMMDEIHVVCGVQKSGSLVNLRC